MERNPEAFTVRVEDTRHGWTVAWRSQAFGFDRYIHLSPEREIDPHQLADFIERLVGRTCFVWANIAHVHNGRRMAEALMPEWDREIHTFMARVETRATRNQYDRMMYSNARYLSARAHIEYYPSPPWYEQEDPKARERARQLLMRNLDAGQLKSFKSDGEFRVTSKNGNVYTIKSARTFNVIAESGVAYCGQVLNVPIEDQMLSQKLLLEQEPETFFRSANTSNGWGQINTIRFSESPPQWARATGGRGGNVVVNGGPPTRWL